MSMPADQLKEGVRLPPLTKGPVTRQMLVEWCAAENDYYHLHYDERVAEAMNLPGPPIQGTFRYALMGQMIRHWAGADALLERISASYRGLDLEGDTISACGEITGVAPTDDGVRVDLDVWIEGEGGKRSTQGTATVLLPSRH